MKNNEEQRSTKVNSINASIKVSMTNQKQDIEFLIDNEVCVSRIFLKSIRHEIRVEPSIINFISANFGKIKVNWDRTLTLKCKKLRKDYRWNSIIIDTKTWKRTFLHLIY